MVRPAEDEEESSLAWPGSPSSPLKAMVKRQYRESLARANPTAGPQRATVRRLEPASPATFMKQGLPIKAEELGRRSLSQADVQHNSNRALSWFRDARQQNVEAKNPGYPTAFSHPELGMRQLAVPGSPRKKPAVNLQKMRQAVNCAMAAKHIMNSGVQVGAGAGLAARIRAKQMAGYA